MLSHVTQCTLAEIPQKDIQGCGLDAVHQRRLFGIAVVVDCSASHHGGTFRSAYGFDGTDPDSRRPHLGEQMGDGIESVRCVGEHGGEVG